MRELLIVGAGIAGLNAARAAAWRASNHVTLIDAHSYQTLAPRLARGAAGLAAFGQMALPLPDSDQRLTRIRGIVTAIDPARRTVTVDDREYGGDRLIIAVGSVPAPTPVGVPGELVHQPYTAEAAARLRLAWHRALAAAANRRPLPGEPVRLVIVGGGAFGCELALAFATMRPLVSARYGLPQEMVEVALCEQAARILPEWPQRAADIVGRELYLSEVDVLTSAQVTRVSRQGLVFAGGDERPGDIVVWAAGRRPNPLLSPDRMPLTDDGRIAVDCFLRLSQHADVYAIGDCAGAGCGWDWAIASARTAIANAASRQPRQEVALPPRRRFIGLPFGRLVSLAGGRFAANAWPVSQTARLLAERRVAGGLPLVLQAWPAPTPDHSLAAWRDATERRRGRHAERRM
ncbi:MAG: NAD(P)/FAD-dependent oxidoreductase [Chloroflexota bacterium]